jgi:hypothetical protein
VAEVTTGRGQPWISFEYDVLRFPLVSLALTAKK